MLFKSMVPNVAGVLNRSWGLLRRKERNDRKFLWHDSNLPMGTRCH